MTKVKVNKQTLVWMYEQGFTAKQMVDHLNENYGGDGVVFNASHVKKLYDTIGMDRRKKPRPSFQIEITEDEPVEEPVESPDDTGEDEGEDPYFVENLEEIPNIHATL